MSCGNIEMVPSTTCPACDYDLRGNPNAQQCPECGFACEPDTICFRPSPASKNLRAFGMLVVLGTLSWLWYTAARGGFATWYPLSAVSLSAALLSPLLFFYRHYSKYCFPCEFLAIGTTKIRWRCSGHPEVAIDWTEIEEVSTCVFLDQVELSLGGSSRTVRIPRRLNPKSMRLSEFASIVQRYSERTRRD
jgi:hypothetical protein